MNENNISNLKILNNIYKNNNIKLQKQDTKMNN
jgi:hypothetical protein